MPDEKEDGKKKKRFNYSIKVAEDSSMDFYIGPKAGFRLIRRLEAIKKDKNELNKVKSIKIIAPFASQKYINILNKMKEEATDKKLFVSIITTERSIPKGCPEKGKKFKTKSYEILKYNIYDKDKKPKDRDVRYMHTKLYIIEYKNDCKDRKDVAFLGSFNFTPSGVMHNIESCLTINDKNLIRYLSRQFDFLHKIANKKAWENNTKKPVDGL